jgi:hypothetical protein
MYFVIWWIGKIADLDYDYNFLKLLGNVADLEKLRLDRVFVSQHVLSNLCWLKLVN